MLDFKHGLLDFKDGLFDFKLRLFDFKHGLLDFKLRLFDFKHGLQDLKHRCLTSSMDCLISKMVNKTTYTSPDASTFDPVGKFILPALAGLDGPLVMVNPGLLLRLAKALLPDLTLEVFITDRDGGKGSLLLGEGRGGTPRGGCC